MKSVSEQPYFTSKDGRAVIFNADVLKTSALTSSTVDLIVTSPPYNVDLNYNSHHDAITHSEYLKFSYEWLGRCFEWLKDDGRLCLNIPLDKNKGGQQSVGADLTYIAKLAGYKYHSTIIWNEGNISRRTAWGSWRSASAPYVIAPVELIVVLYKETWKKASGSRLSDISKDEFMTWTQGVWEFCGESKKRIGHPAPFPVELPMRCIKLFSFVDDLVLDPFMGSGTTLVAASLNNRRSVGFDIDEVYCNLATDRVNSLNMHHQQSLISEEDNEMEEADSKDTITALIKQYFLNHPNEELEHGPIVDYVTEEWLKTHNTPPRDPWRIVRGLKQKGFLVKVRKGVYKYDPDTSVDGKGIPDFTPTQKEEIFKRDGYRCVMCGKGNAEGIEIHADHVKPRDLGGTSEIGNGQTLCAQHNLIKKTLKQTETGKKMFIHLYELAKLEGNKELMGFCEAVLQTYVEYHINDHVKWNH